MGMHKTVIDQQINYVRGEKQKVKHHNNIV